MTFLRFVSFLVVGSLLSACGEQDSNEVPATPEAVTACSIDMGWDPWEPYQFANINGTVVGLDVEIVSAIVEHAGCSIEFTEGNWSTLLSQIENGEIDVLAGATKTESRAQFAWFTDPYREETFGLYVRAADREEYPEQDLVALMEHDARIGVTLDYVYGDEVTGLQDDPEFSEQFVGVPISELNYSKLADMEIDGFLEDPFVAAAILRRKGLGDQIVAHDIVIHTGVVHLMLSKASINEEMFNHLNASLVALKEDGTIDRILNKYRE